MSPTDSMKELPFPKAAHAALSAKPSEIEREVMELFEQFPDPLLRYTLSFGISIHDAEEVIQEVSLSLFRHLQLCRSRENLRGWIFRVAHSLTLKQLYANQRSQAKTTSDRTIAEEQLNPTPNPEEQVSSAQRRHRLLAVVHALPEADQGCLRLRAEVCSISRYDSYSRSKSRGRAGPHRHSIVNCNTVRCVRFLIHKLRFSRPRRPNWTVANGLFSSFVFLCASCFLPVRRRRKSMTLPGSFLTTSSSN